MLEKYEEELVLELARESDTPEKWAAILKVRQDLNRRSVQGLLDPREHVRLLASFGVHINGETYGDLLRRTHEVNALPGLHRTAARDWLLMELEERHAGGHGSLPTSQFRALLAHIEVTVIPDGQIASPPSAIHPHRFRSAS